MSFNSFEEALRCMDAENTLDPNQVEVNGLSRPVELLYAERLTAWILKLDDHPSPELLLAARAAHIGRWRLQRHDYETGLNGYLQWREDLKQLHAQTTTTLLNEVGIDADIIQKVTTLIKKENFPDDPESRVLEDALCLMFLEYQFDDVAEKTDPAKMVGILQKTWDKMSPTGKAAALRLSYSPSATSLLKEAGLTS